MFYLFIPPVIDIWVVSTSLLLQVILLWTFVCVCSIFTFVRDIPRSGIAESCGSCLFTFWEIARSFFKAAAYFTFPLTVCKFSNLSTSSPTCYCLSFNFNNPSGCQVILIWISRSVTDVGHNFICLLAICVSSLCSGNVLNPLSIFHLGCLFVVEL